MLERFKQNKEVLVRQSNWRPFWVLPRRQVNTSLSIYLVFIANNWYRIRVTRRYSIGTPIKSSPKADPGIRAVHLAISPLFRPRNLPNR